MLCVWVSVFDILDISPFSIFLCPLSTQSKNSLPSFLFCYVPFQDEFYQQLQAIRQPWHIPSDTDSDILEPPEQDKSKWPT